MGLFLLARVMWPSCSLTLERNSPYHPFRALSAFGASGEKLLRDPAKLLAVRLEQHGKVEVGEMEAAGLVAACRRANIPWLVIRGISDFGDSLKDDQFHDFASRTAATVLADFLAHGLTISENAGAEVQPITTPVPHYPDDETRRLSLQIEKARERKRRLQGVGQSTAQVDGEILRLRRQLREGGQLRAGDSLGEGRFLLIESIGQGGFAHIWKAADRVRAKNVAIKVLHTSLAGNMERRERFFRGARIMAELQHPAVVRVIEQQGEDGGYHYFVMEYVAGGNLRQAVLKKALTPDQVISVILRVGEALALAHARGIIHRDVKPANILLDSQEQPLLTDFDLVGAADTTGGTRTGAMGTFVYAAPECLDRPQEADQRADIYSLGMTTVFGLHGTDLPVQILRNPELVISRLPCSQPLKEVLSQAISLEPRDRYQQVNEFLAAVDQARHGSPSPSEVRKHEASREESRELYLTVSKIRELRTGAPFFSILATNHSRNQEVEVTEIWLQLDSPMPVIDTDMPLPRKLKPNESFSLWLKCDAVPEQFHENIYTLARARLLNGQITASINGESEGAKIVLLD